MQWPIDRFLASLDNLNKIARAESGQDDERADMMREMREMIDSRKNRDSLPPFWTEE